MEYMSTRLAGRAAQNRTNSSIAELLETNQILAEGYADAAAAILQMRAEDEGWTPLNRLKQEDGFELESLKEIAKHAELQAEGNPLLKRGFTLRRDNVFGRGVIFQENPEYKISKRIRDILDKPTNRDVLFEQSAWDKNERAAFIAGNLIMAYRISTEEFFPISFEEISNFASNPDRKTRVDYYQRSWTKIDESTNQPETTPTVEWYPVLERWEQRSRKPLQTSIAKNPVNDDVVIIDFKVNTSNEHIWGVPDCLPAMPYAWAHAEYVKDASKLLKALATIAWKVVAKSKGNAINAAAKSALPKQTASTASMTAGTDLVSMPKAGQVDMKDGFTILAYVASALEVSAIALSSDPASATGSAAAASTLDGPSANAARARQALWVQFYKRVYRMLGIKDVIVNFPKIQEDPIYRTAQTLQIGFAYGALHQDEFRASFLEATDAVKLRDELPEPAPFTAAAQYSLEAIQIKADQEEAKAQSGLNPANVTGQGQSRPNGTALGSDNTGRDMDRNPGDE